MNSWGLCHTFTKKVTGGGMNASKYIKELWSNKLSTASGKRKEASINFPVKTGGAMEEGPQGDL